MMSEMSGRLIQAKQTMAEVREVLGRNVALAGSESDAGFLGWQLMCSFRHMEIPKERIIEWWEGQDVLDERDMPGMPSAVDAFQKACSAENIRIWNPLKDYILTSNYRERYGGDLVNVRFLTIPVKGKSTEYVLEQRVWVASADREVRPEHPNIARIRLVPVRTDEGNSWRVEVSMFEDFQGGLDGGTSSDLRDKILDIVTREHNRRLNIVDDVRVRNALYSLVENVSGVRWMAGGNNGCYFIPPRGKPRVEAFMRFVEEVAVPYSTDPYSQTLIRLTPLVDQAQMREYLAQDVRTELEERWAKLCDDALNFINKKAGENKLDEKAEEVLAKRLYEVEKLKISKEKYEQVLGFKISLNRRPSETMLSESARSNGRIVAMLDALNNAIQ